MRSLPRIAKPKVVGWNLFEKICLAAFLIWSAAGLIFTIDHITPEAIANWSVPGWLARFVEFCLHNGDPVLILLAFTNTHLHSLHILFTSLLCSLSSSVTSSL